ncbi:MAG: NAD(P)/FAD-dependent oxidoreductase [Solirubrobacterales bacterium]|nr:NAD(P)/FAD-dependent oxidoreductase [Solirubrobacterales bacterium]
MTGEAVVIGSGPNGLAAAIALARAGRAVTVLEAAPAPGGAVLTRELTLPGFHHDVFSSVYPAAAASPVFADMPLEDHGLRWIHPEACYAHPLPDGRGAALYRDLDRTAQSLEALAPGQGEGWRRFAGPLVAHFAAVRDTMLSGFPPIPGAARLTVGLRPRGLLEFARLLLMPAQGLAGELFTDSAARAWLYGSAMHGDVPPTGAGSAIAAAYLNLLGHGAGWPSPEGGAGRLSGALASYLGSLGGMIRTGAEVVEIAARQGRVGGVRLANGEQLAASLVIATVMPGALARMAGPALPASYARALTRYRPGPATLKLDWALDGPIPWRSQEARRAGTVHVGGDESEVLEATTTVSGLPERPFLLVGQQSVADPSRAPAGKHTAWAYTHGPQTIDWVAEQERHAERVEDQIERFAPGFRELILARHVLAPGDLERRNPNLIGGDVGGGSYTLDQVVFRPVVKLNPYLTPLRGLYIGGAATFPGGAVHGVPGHTAARLALMRDRLRIRSVPGPRRSQASTSPGS